MKGPVGACKHCGQEFMSKQGLAYHERQACPQRPPDAPEKESEAPPVAKRARFSPRHVVGGVTLWTREGDERF